MAIQVHRPAWISKGWMSFTVANGGVLRLGGASQTVPTSQLSVSNFLASGIPQNLDATAFADVAIGDGKNPNGHSIKHAVIKIVSGGATNDPAARVMQDGSTPTTSLGEAYYIGDIIEIHNSRSDLFNFKLFNRSGGNMVVEVRPAE